MRFNNRFCYIFRIIVLVLTVLFTNGWTQKKKLTYDQAFQRGEPLLLGSLPRIQGWLDDEHYLEMRSEGEEGQSGLKLMKVNVITDESSIYFDDEKYKDPHS